LCIDSLTHKIYNFASFLGKISPSQEAKLRGRQGIIPEIGVLLFLLFPVLPPVEPLTPLGMKDIGVFIFTMNIAFNCS
jgi:hypothetical protein